MRRAGYIVRRVVVSTRLATRRVARAATTRWDRWLDRFERLGLSENATVLTFAIAVGLAAAVGVVLFYWVSISSSPRSFSGRLARFRAYLSLHIDR